MEVANDEDDRNKRKSSETRTTKTTTRSSLPPVQLMNSDEMDTFRVDSTRIGSIPPPPPPHSLSNGNVVNAHVVGIIVAVTNKCLLPSIPSQHFYYCDSSS